ncbi:MAG: S8 family serine peptidase [Clostridiales bacterium]|nr:S8 family serine peptidase [Clostridiales bacterium]
MTKVPSSAYPAGSEATTQAMLDALPDLTGKILVVGRGIAFTQYWNAAVAKNAAGLICINRDDEYIGNAGWCGINGELAPFAVMPAFTAPVSAYAAFSSYLGTTTPAATASWVTTTPMTNRPAEFSSIGPVYGTNAIKPDIIAPGANILTTSLNSEYAYMGGTSFAAPAVTATYALLKQAYPSAQPWELKARIMNTADPFLINPHNTYPGPGNNTNPQISVWEQGAGFVDPVRAVDTNVVITVQDPSVNNGGGQPAAHNMASFSFGELPTPFVANPIEATVSGVSSFTVTAMARNSTRYSLNATGYVTPVITYPSAGKFAVGLTIADGTPVGLYEGYIKVTANGQDYYLPWGVRVISKNVTGFRLFADHPTMCGYGFSYPDDSTYSSRNVAYLSFTDSAMPNRVMMLTSGSGTATTWFLPIYLIDKDNNQNQYVYYYQVGTGSTFSLATWWGTISTRRAFPITQQANGYSTDGGASWTYSTRTVADGNYFLALYTSSTYPGGAGWVGYPQLGFTVSTARADIVYHNAATTNNATSWGDVRVSDAPTSGIYMKPVPSAGTTSVTVTGRIETPALTAAINAGFMWIANPTASTLTWYYLDYHWYNIFQTASSPYSLMRFTPQGSSTPTEYVFDTDTGEFAITMSTSLIAATDVGNGYRYFMSYATPANASTAPTFSATGANHGFWPVDARDYRRSVAAVTTTIPGAVEIGHSYGYGSIPCIKLCSVHSNALDMTTRIPGTCMQFGYTGDTKCVYCGVISSMGSWTLPKDPNYHVGERVHSSAPVTATCVIPAKTPDLICSGCLGTLIPGTTGSVDPTNHVNGFSLDIPVGSAIDERSQCLNSECPDCHLIDTQYIINSSLGLKVRLYTWDALQFAMNINVDELAALLQTGDSFTYGFYAFPQDLLDSMSPTRALGTQHNQTLFWGSADGSAIDPLEWDASYATPSVLAAALKTAGYMVYDSDDTRGTLTLSIIIMGLGGMPDRDLTFRPFVTLGIGEDSYTVYGRHLYNNINKIRAFVEQVTTSASSLEYLPQNW